MDCQTGDLLCLASMPAYDPNVFTDGISRAEWAMFSEDERKPLLNKALNALYPPGSTIKPSSAVALLEAGIDPEERVSCGGGYQLGNRFFQCLGRHGPMTMHTAIARSCNTYFYSMGRRVGFDRIAPVWKELGLGQRFDLPVVSQSYGTVPDSAWKQRRYDQNPKAFYRRDWTESDTLNASIGQGYVILNPLQLATYAACVASGKKVRPRLVAGEGPAPQRLPYAPDNLAKVRHGMWEVVNGAGTAGRSRLPFPDIAMCGKTGTAQVRRLGASAAARPGRRLALPRPRPVRLLRALRPAALRRRGGDRARHGRRPRRRAGRQGRAHLSVRQGPGDDRARRLRAAMGRHPRRAHAAPRRRMGRRPPPPRPRFARGEADVRVALSERLFRHPRESGDPAPLVHAETRRRRGSVPSTRRVNLSASNRKGPPRRPCIRRAAPFSGCSAGLSASPRLCANNLRRLAAAIEAN